MRDAMLIVDDNEHVLRLLREHFEEIGWVVFEAGNLESAFRILRENAARIAIILSDDAMGGKGLDGSDLFFRCSGVLETNGIPFILMTGALVDFTFMEATERAGMRVLQKPFRLGKVEGMVRSLVKEWPRQAPAPSGSEL